MKRMIYFVFITASIMLLFGCKKDGTNGPKSKSPLCFTARNGSVDVRFDIMNVTHTIQYSTDGKKWSNYTSGLYVRINANQSIYFRAESNQTVASAFGSGSPNSNSHFYFTSSNGSTVEGSGNIMSLYGPDCPDLPLPNSAFLSLFEDCITLTTAPALPATNLALCCYEGMFSGCTALTRAPSSLPAVILAERCYKEMFKCCTSLTTAPSLPATTLADECYHFMFIHCTSLTTAPTLPATALAYDCYRGMFMGCTALTTAPSLPATTLDGGCYEWMFYDCTALTTAPSLPATTLARWCYCKMFAGCSSLVVNSAEPGTPWQIPSNAKSADDWNNSMFYETGGNFTGDPEIGVTYYIASEAR